jgi:hypothetical protein
MRKTPQMVQHWSPSRGSSYVLQGGKGGGGVAVDSHKKYITPFTLTSEPEEILVPAGELMCPGVYAGGVVPQAVVFPLETKGPFEICYTAFTAKYASGPNAGQPTDQFMVVIFGSDVKGKEPLLMNREIHASTMAGGFGDPLANGVVPALQSAAGRPFVWPETLFLDPSRDEAALFMGYRNLSVYDILVRWVFHGVLYYDENDYTARIGEKQAMAGPGKVALPYFYTPDTNVRLAGGQTFNFDMRITDEADVEIFKQAVFSDYPFLWRFQEKLGKRQLDNAGLDASGNPNGVHSSFGWGTGEFPFIHYETLYMQRNTKLMLQFTNSLTDQMNRIFPTLVCRKIEDANKPASSDL